MLNKKYLRFMLILLFATSFVTTDSFTNLTSTQTFAQPRVADFFGLWRRKDERKVSRTSRSGGVCPITPGIFETYLLWHERPLFVWKSSGNQDANLVVRGYDSQTEVWRQPVNTSAQKLLYGAEKALEPGKLYQWQLVNKSRGLNESVTFQIMSETERAKIQSGLQALEQSSKLAKSSPEDIALKKAHYFLDYQIKHQNSDRTYLPWSDALQSLYEVDKPSASFIEQRDKFIVSLCSSNSTASK
ncbi:hypothetical protein NIES2101_07385 [Calothrix sp. HK-06]|nr:hypothetical protein NIES2101_07385 [Calothrix sp. HK-06]